MKNILLLAQCDGKHKTLDGLFTCMSCRTLLKPVKPTAIAVEYIDTPLQYIIYRRVS